MSVYPAPTNQQGSIFNPSLWIVDDITGVSVNYLNAHYLEYPVAQGYETLNGISNLGDTIFSNIPTCLATQPASTDSSTKMPTTAWVQSAISGSGSTNYFPKASYFIYNLPNTSGIPTPYPTLSFTGFSGLNYWDGVAFKLRVNYTIYASTTTTSSYSVSTYNSDYSCGAITIYPKAFTTCSAQNVFYLNNAIGSTTANTSYGGITSATSVYTPNGRPFYANSPITNETNIDVVFPITFSNDGTTASMIFNFPAINWGTATTGSYSINLELLNLGRFTLSQIHTSNFTINF